jgi:23S rRNA (adenine2503-C2)-methyltransferase
MIIIKNVKVPTGNILIVEGERGKLECLSIGDYGKGKNLKADFMGLSEEINGVPHGKLLPLSKKWVITISSQYGCSMGCKFCDVPKVGWGINATENDLINQVMTGISLHPEIDHTDRLNIHYARMGEPTWNFAVIEATYVLNERIKKERGWGFHPVVSTMMPRKNNRLIHFLDRWLILKNDWLNGEVGLQLSINTTDEKIRRETFNNNAMTLEEISKMFEIILSDLPKRWQLQGRKYTLNFALTDAEINAEKLRELFSPRLFLCKITPMHKTTACENNNLLTKDGYDSYYPYKQVEENLKKVGFDVIVFVPSHEEDESRITCGNAILANRR